MSASTRATPPITLSRRIAETWRYALCRLRGQNYLRYQQQRYDRLWRDDPHHFSYSSRQFQLDYCLGHGLRRGMRLLDFGCGPVAAGLAMIRYLDPGGYVGADISRTALNLGTDRIAAAELAARRPDLVLLPATEWLAPLARRSFDMIWAQSVLTHMAPKDTETLISAVPHMLTPTGCLLATFYLHDTPGPRRADIKDWSYDLATLAHYAEAAGLQASLLDDFRHPRPYVRHGHHMAMLHLSTGRSHCVTKARPASGPTDTAPKGA
ncbi:class I SAM-dependent methyltransferase [Streptomyces sp. NPDC051913]|uniref:class I SAM-dependent methyltransferase n=1 Tax=Streptomyces sp. NPDC051913 TaxID=3365676 RepID=UPI0037D4153F